MDGGGGLLGPFVAQLPFASSVLEYPPDEVLGYRALEARARAALAAIDGKVVLVAESFSGPIAIRIAADPPPNLAAVVLVATFTRWRAPSFLRPFVRAPLFMIALPKFFLRRYFVSDDTPEPLVDALRRAIAAPAPSVLAARAREILACDVSGELDRIRLPTLCLEGTRDRLAPRGLSGHPALRCERVEAPHLILECAPEESAAIILRFLAESGLRA